MIFLDTNLLVYCTIESLDKKKYSTSTKIIIENIEKNITLSPLIISEYIYVLSRFKEVTNDAVLRGYETFIKYVSNSIDKDIISTAFYLSNELNMGNHINDIVHLKFAEKYCEKLITFDKGFNQLKNHTNIEIQILE